jgi:hypothetical protein
MKNHHQPILVAVLGTLDQGEEPAKVCLLKLILMPLKSGKLKQFGLKVYGAVKIIGGEDLCV